MKTMKEYADAYRNKMKWVVLPVFNYLKFPSQSWKQYQERFPTQEEHDDWFSQPNITGIAVITGKLSNVVVIDEDSYKKDGKILNLNTPFKVKTASGGIHYYFQYRAGVRNTANAQDAVDRRAEGGLVIAPPSTVYKKNEKGEVTKELGKYEWLMAEDKTHVMPSLEESFSQSLADNPKKKINIADYVDLEIGSRNTNLHALACSLLNHHTPEEALVMIKAVNNSFKPPMPDSEVRTIFEQARKFVSANPMKNKQEIELDKYVPPKPLTLAQVGLLRNEERELEKSAPSTGFPELDDVVGGFIPTHLYLLTGDTSVGKTAMASNFMHRVIAQGKKVAYYALEPRNKIVEYYHTVRLNKDFSQLTDSDLLTEVPNASIFINQKNNDRIDTIEKLVKSIESLERQDLIIIDHIGYFIQNVQNTTQVQANAVKKLVDIVNDQKNAILYIVHQKKGTNKGSFDMDMISGSASFKQDSTEVFMMKRLPLTEDKNDVSLSQIGYLAVTKTKMGPTRSVKLFFSERSGRVDTESALTKRQIADKMFPDRKAVGK